MREEIGAFVGIVVGAKLRWLRVVGRVITTVDWSAHDEPWQPPAAGGTNAQAGARGCAHVSVMALAAFEGSLLS